MNRRRFICSRLLRRDPCPLFIVTAKELAGCLAGRKAPHPSPQHYCVKDRPHTGKCRCSTSIKLAN